MLEVAHVDLAVGDGDQSMSAAVIVVRMWNNIFDGSLDVGFGGRV
jgi:hypothetical protein